MPKPTIDPSWYSNAKPGPDHRLQRRPDRIQRTPPTCPRIQRLHRHHVQERPASTTTRRENTSLGRVDLLAFGSFDCRYYNLGRRSRRPAASGTGSPGHPDDPRDRLHRRQPELRLAGTTPSYQGRGTIYVNGTVSFTGQTNICASPISGNPCLGNYDAEQQPARVRRRQRREPQPTGFSMTGQDTFEGVAFIEREVQRGRAGTVHGPVIADTATIAGNGDSAGRAIDPPPGAPGAAYDDDDHDRASTRRHSTECRARGSSSGSHGELRGDCRSAGCGGAPRTTTASA